MSSEDEFTLSQIQEKLDVEIGVRAIFSNLKSAGYRPYSGRRSIRKFDFKPFLRLGMGLALLRAMPRPHRIRQFEFPYSVTTRCNNKDFHLEKRIAYRVFESVFRKLKSLPKSEEDPSPRYEFEVHHLVVMSNHYHLVVSVSKNTPIDRLMQQVNSMVARAMNRILNRTGHLWGERFKSKILNSLDYLKQTIGYVYRNPVVEKMAEDLLSYAKSTLRFYWSQCLPSWVTPDPFLSSLPLSDWGRALELLVLKTEVA